MDKWIYFFGKNINEGDASKKDLLGSKGANLAEISRFGINIPAGFTITTDLCKAFFSKGLPNNFEEEIRKSIKLLEKETGKTFGSKENTLLVSVRSGAKVSMPGMMDTILNLGINDEIAAAIASKTEDVNFAYSIYLKFIKIYSELVMKVPPILLENIKFKGDNYFEIIKEVKRKIENYKGDAFPEDPYYQLFSSIKAVLSSWNSSRAKIYRTMHNIPENLGTAVNVQSMVFGNLGKNSGTGVLFTRNPSTGENTIFGEFLENAQGEDIVSGSTTPVPINAASDSMEASIPEVYNELIKISKDLEKHYGDMQDIEFTVENGKLYILQTRAGKRTPAAGIKIAVEMVKEGLISKEEAILRVPAESLKQVLHAVIEEQASLNIISTGLPASPGAAVGIAVFSVEEAEEFSKFQNVILIRNDTSPEDIKGMHISSGIITARGGMTSHAAVVARGIGKPCVCGVKSLRFNNDSCCFGEIIVKKGDTITIDGATGRIILGNVKLKESGLSEELNDLLGWCDQFSRIKVRGNAETVNDVKNAIAFGAEGIGLCRTEHMFFDSHKLHYMREVILTSNVDKKSEIINTKIYPFHRQDFIEIFEEIKGFPINIRLLDPPLHEFLPHNENEILKLAESLNLSIDVIKEKISKLKEVNPMLGHRGCRLAISFEDIYKMQIDAILSAAVEVYRRHKIMPNFEIMIPFVIMEEEVNVIVKQFDEVIEKYKSHNPEVLKFKIGTMIELPRAAIISDKLANKLDYFSFGTNDLTQTTLGISRDDIGSFYEDYHAAKIFKEDPFIRIDEEGVGELIRLSISKARNVKPDFKVSVCGEHGGNPPSIEFFDNLGVNFVSCSPFRVPIAKLAAAQSKLKQSKYKASNQKINEQKQNSS